MNLRRLDRQLFWPEAVPAERLGEWIRQQLEPDGQLLRWAITAVNSDAADTTATVLDACSSKPEYLPGVEQQLLPVVAKILHPNGDAIEYIETACEILAYLTYYNKPLSPALSKPAGLPYPCSGSSTLCRRAGQRPICVVTGPYMSPARHLQTLPAL